MAHPIVRIQNLRKAFGHMGLNEVKPRDVYQYVDARSKK